MSCWVLPGVGRQLRRSLSSFLHSKAVHFHFSDSNPLHLLLLFTFLLHYSLISQRSPTAMSGIAHNLVRRAVDVTQQHYNTSQGDNDDQIKRIAMWGMILIWVTGVLYFAMMSAVNQFILLKLAVYGD